jgi:membrane protease subunit HflK
MTQNQFNMPPFIQQVLRNIKTIVIAAFVLIVFWSAFFQVEPEEVGVITRFGKYTTSVQPGLNFKIPLIDRVTKVPVERQQKLEFGFRTVSADIRSEYTKEGTADESLMLTGDLNLADVEWVVQYRIDDPYKYLFMVRNPEQTLRDIAESTMRQVVGDRTVNEVLTVGRMDISQTVKDLMQVICVEYAMGVKIEQVVLQDVNPPDPVKAAFNAVNEAQQEKETLINQAKSEYNKVIPHAHGQAEETIQKAEGYATARVNNALGEAARFNMLYQEYMKAPDVTRRRIYLETMQKVLPNLGNKIITDQDGNNVVPLLQMQMNQSKPSVNSEK